MQDFTNSWSYERQEYEPNIKEVFHALKAHMRSSVLTPRIPKSCVDAYDWSTPLPGALFLPESTLVTTERDGDAVVIRTGLDDFVQETSLLSQQGFESFTFQSTV